MIIDLPMNEVNIHYEIKGLRFECREPERLGVAVVRGDATVACQAFGFELVASPIDDGQWELVSLNWHADRHPPRVLGGLEFTHGILNRTARLLDTVNMWPAETTSAGAQMCLNERVIPDEVKDRVIVSYRPNVLGIPSARWEYLWDHIYRRVDADPYFHVLGFEHSTVERVLPLLRNTFSDDWVCARYRAAGLSKMADPLEREDNQWFPAYHLARTAHGITCRDPAWNYLVEIGLSMEALQGFDGVEKLSRQLSRSPGTQHHFCMAAELHNRGLLEGLEPPTGSGSASSDLLVAGNSQLYQIEVKEFTSQNPIRKLRQELFEKATKLPRIPKHPVVFHVTLSERGAFNKTREEAFFSAVGNLKADIPDSISAIAAGKRFVDSMGGRVKRDLECVILNPSGNPQARESELRTLFGSTHQQLSYPLYGIGSFIACEGRNRRQEPELH